MRLNFKVWIEDENGKPIMGKGGVELVKSIIETGSIAGAADKVNVSYKFAWEYVRRINSFVGGIEFRKGGKNAGGTEVSERVKKMIEIYEEAVKEVNQVLEKYNKKLNELSSS
jgi:molybdate transport system regulatory protein